VTQRRNTSTKVNKKNIYTNQNIYIANIELKRTRENGFKYLIRSAKDAVDYVNNSVNMLSCNQEEEKKIIQKHAQNSSEKYLLALAIRMNMRKKVSEIRSKKKEASLENISLKIQLSQAVTRVLQRRGITKESITEQKILNDLLNDSEILSEFQNFHKEVKKLKVDNKYCLGNCYEKAVIAMCYLLEKDPKIPIRLAKLVPNTIETVNNNQNLEELGDDHTFVLIGKGADFQIDKPETWHEGSDVVVCDPWAKRAYKIHNFNAEMAHLKLTTKMTMMWTNITEDNK
jgi:hypothetical protein